MQKRFYVFLVAMFFALPFACNLATAHADARTITVGGESSFYVAPDEATIQLGVQTTGRQAQDVSQKNAMTVSEVKNALLSMGISPENIETASYDFSPTYENDGQSIKGYQAQNNLLVKTDDLKQIGKIIDTAIKNGATQVNAVNFHVKNVEAAKDKALRLAVLNAKSKAEAIANELHRNIINVVSVNANNVYVENYQAPNEIMLRSSVGNAAVTTPIAARNLKVRANLEIKFEIN